MGFFNDVVNVGTLGLVPDITGEQAAADAAAYGIAANQASQAEIARQFDITQANLQPFLEAGTGALGQYQAGLDGAPQTPTLAQFAFDPTAALDSPAMQFQREMGEQQLARSAAANRNLSAGNRLIEAEKFGQGLASQYLGEEYGRQLGTYDVNRTTDLQNYGLVSDRYNQRMNRLAGLIDVGRGTGSALGQFGAQASGNIADLMQNTGQLQGAAALAGQQGTMNILNMGAQVGGMVTGMPPVGAMGGGGSVMGFNPSPRGFF